LARIELRVLPHRAQFRGADVVRVCAAFEIDGVADSRQLACPGIDLARPGPSDIENFFVLLSVAFPDFDHLDAVEVAAVGVLRCPDREPRRFAGCGSRREIAPMGTPGRKRFLTQQRFSTTFRSNLQPPKKRTWSLVPVVAKVSRRRSAA